MFLKQTIVSTILKEIKKNKYSWTDPETKKTNGELSDGSGMYWSTKESILGKNGYIWIYIAHLTGNSESSKGYDLYELKVLEEIKPQEYKNIYCKEEHTITGTTLKKIFDLAMYQYVTNKIKENVSK